ncbi:hypothetical protein [Staphylococcus kloosii]|jgi:hypothetical protein|uniref:hypothetical protein n=1 Tax=Staphylococcus kloosii TaxID=29384 RepID=UPI0018A07CA0|nr:hypothetical protein [Staphylococcus kloosii]MBF7023648.1 hypothetical protein [Staphylococcus kloosii]
MTRIGELDHADVKYLEMCFFRYDDYKKVLNSKDNSQYSEVQKEKMKVKCDAIDHIFEIATPELRGILKMMYFDAKVYRNKFGKLIIEREHVNTMSEVLGISVRKIHAMKRKAIKKYADLIVYV